MANALKVKVIVEGVETMEQLELVHELGCYLIQGFLFSKPMKHQQATQFLTQNKKIRLSSNKTNEHPRIKSIT